jgi:integrase
MGGWNKGLPFWPMHQWPEMDRATWLRHCSPGDSLDDPCYGATLRPVTRDFLSHGYGAWLYFLNMRGWLDSEQPPLQRVTRRRLRAYFRALQAAGYADLSIIARFSALTYAMKILAPGQDVSWIQRPDGVTIYRLLNRAQRPLLVPDSRVLYQWGLDIMDSAATPNDYQDGLFIAMLASRGRRLRSMALLRVGQELVMRGGRYWIELTAEQVKTKRPDQFDLPEPLTPYIHRYLAEMRPALLGSQSHDAVWVGRRGEPWAPQNIKNRIRLLTRKRFGQSFGPHRFRHAIATTAALRDPAHPGLAAGLLGITSPVIEEHYNRAGQTQAMLMFDEAVVIRRRTLKRQGGISDDGIR